MKSEIKETLKALNLKTETLIQEIREKHKELDLLTTERQKVLEAHRKEIRDGIR